MLKSLQAARAMAALMVVLFHLGLVIEKYFNTNSLTAPWGRSGVEFFFVLSGFIITTAHTNDIGKRERLGIFIRKRLVRIYPIYWLVFLVTLAGGYRFVDLSIFEVFTALSLAPTGTVPVISVAWSLQWEMVFYVIFGLSILNPAAGLVSLFGAFFFLPGATIFLSLFLAGAFFSLIQNYKFPFHGPKTAFAGAAIFATAGTIETVYGSQSNFLYGLGSGILIFGLVQSERAGTIIGRNQILQLIGNSSYSIYLLHYPLISVICKILIYIGMQGTQWSAAVYLILLITSVLGGVSLHLFVEQPLLNRLNSAQKIDLRNIGGN
ncbi:acyltransferase family protein [Roseateles sp. GG27B]